MIKYISTRGAGPVDFETALLQGLAPDGGLYVPERWPQIDAAGLKGKSYGEIAEAVMFPFVEGCITREDFRTMIAETYSAEIFHGETPAPLHHLKDNFYVLELFHGPTLAFKDIALQLLGRLFDHVLKKRNQRITIIGATSGDTGSAAIEGCRHSARADIFILYPHGRVSEVQRRQMTTVNVPNVHCIAVEGSFDDCQALVKAMFNDAEFRVEHNLSAVNSINWARIMAQIVYYFTAALVFDEPAHFVVPTGNFGNVLAGHYARLMGAPIAGLSVATNRNDILTRFFESGEMRIEGVTPTISPSMDIQVSSNFERYVFELLGRDVDALKEFMGTFQKDGVAALSSDITQSANQAYKAFRCLEEQTTATIKCVYEETGYTLDPHTAVGVKGALELAGGTQAPVISLATAHPAKFPDAVEQAIGVRPQLPAHLADLFDREEKYVTLPADLKQVQDFIKQHV